MTNGGVGHQQVCDYILCVTSAGVRLYIMCDTSRCVSMLEVCNIGKCVPMLLVYDISAGVLLLDRTTEVSKMWELYGDN